MALLIATHLLIFHLWKMIRALSRKDSTGNMKVGKKKVIFCKLQKPNPDYAMQIDIPNEDIYQFMVCLFFYNLDVGNVMRFSGNKYTASYYNIVPAVKKMRELGVDYDVIPDIF